MGGRLGFVLFLLVSVLWVHVSHGKNCSATDYSALQYLVQELVYVGHEFRTWQPDTDCCSWEGVVCNSAGNVEDLNIVAKDVPTPRPEGPPYSVGTGLSDCNSLKNMTMLNIAFNGQIPSSWGSLPDLEVINLDGCQVVGTIPANLCKLTKLKIFILKGNLLSAVVPDCISKETFPNLEFLEFTRNPKLKGFMKYP